MIPEMLNIPDKYSHLALMSPLSVLKEDRVKTLFSQQIKKLTSYFYAMSIL